MGLIGYSWGADTIRHVPYPCPRVYIGGPGWYQKCMATPPEMGPVPGGPSAQLQGAADSLMQRFQLSPDVASACTGHATPAERTIVPPEALGELALAPNSHLRVDFEDHNHSSCKFPAFALSERRTWERLFCGYNPWGALGVDKAVMDERASASADAVARFLVATMR